MYNDSLFSIFFKRMLIMILPIMLLFSFATSLGLTFGNNPFFQNVNVMNTYFGFQSFFNMVDDIGVSVNGNIHNFLEHFKSLGTVVSFNLGKLIDSIKGGNALLILIDGFITYFVLSFYPILFIVVVLACVMDIIAIISNILSVVLSAFWGHYNLPYTEIYTDLPPLVSNVITPVFLF